MAYDAIFVVNFDVKNDFGILREIWFLFRVIVDVILDANNDVINDALPYLSEEALSFFRRDRSLMRYGTA